VDNADLAQNGVINNQTKAKTITQVLRGCIITDRSSNNMLKDFVNFQPPHPEDEKTLFNAFF
jgi:hypothetical protein